MRKKAYDKLNDNGKKWYNRLHGGYSHRTSLKLSRELENNYDCDNTLVEQSAVVNSSGVRKFKKYIDAGYEKIYAYCCGLAKKYLSRIDFFIFVKLDN